MSNPNRIRYMKYDHRPGYKISIRAFTSSRTGAKYRVIMSETELNYFIRNERTKEFVKKSRQHKNLNVMKREAREDLESLGVQFKRESRWRSFGLCEKGYSQSKHVKAERNIEKKDGDNEN